ncbi:MAG: hypothetical protein JXN64_11070 [Spirochaetes bacterium]|nr:hypothetical protein [Spirochaetota bacterium]
MNDYTVYYQKFDQRLKKWDFELKVFNSEAQAKKFGAEILKLYPNNEVIIKSKEYKIIYENDRPAKKYIGKEKFIVKSTSESHTRLLQEVFPSQHVAGVR